MGKTGHINSVELGWILQVVRFRGSAQIEVSITHPNKTEAITMQMDWIGFCIPSVSRLKNNFNCSTILDQLHLCPYKWV